MSLAQAVTTETYYIVSNLFPALSPWQACSTGRGDGDPCRKCGVNYQVECQLYPAGRRSLYHGESARNLFTRGREHVNKYSNNNAKSFMLKHQEKEQQGMGGDYTAKVTGTAKDCLTRQVKKAVLLRRCQVPTLNSKTKWYQPLLFRIQHEILKC